MKTITQHTPLIFSRLEEARLRSEIRWCRLRCLGWQLGTLAMLGLGGWMLRVIAG
jgi:hypothetical protein